MNVFKRMGDIMNANMNSILDKWEDPDKMIDLMISDLEETLDKARANLAGHKAEQKTLEREKLELAAAVSRWEERAKMAVDKGRDDLAREALVEKRSAISRKESTDKQVDTLKTIIASEETQVAEIHDKLEEVKSKKDALVERAKSAKQKKDAEEVIKKSEGYDVSRKFSEMEARIERMEEDANMTRYNGGESTEGKFQKMENDSAIEDELKAMKEKANDSEKDV